MQQSYKKSANFFLQINIFYSWDKTSKNLQNKLLERREAPDSSVALVRAHQ